MTDNTLSIPVFHPGDSENLKKSSVLPSDQSTDTAAHWIHKLANCGVEGTGLEVRRARPTAPLESFEEWRNYNKNNRYSVNWDDFYVQLVYDRDILTNSKRPPIPMTLLESPQDLDNDNIFPDKRLSNDTGTYKAFGRSNLKKYRRATLVIGNILGKPNDYVTRLESPENITENMVLKNTSGTNAVQYVFVDEEGLEFLEENGKRNCTLHLLRRRDADDTEN